MTSGLSFRAAARRVGCTHKAISGAVTARRIPLLPDGTVAPADVDAWNAGRRAKRGGATRRHAKRPAEVSAHASHLVAEPLAAPPPRPPTPAGSLQIGLPDDASTVSAALEAGALDLAMVCLRHVPEATARLIVGDWLAVSLAGWVGAPDAPESAAEVADWPLPDGCASWGDHPAFDIAPAAVDWRHAEADALAWRTARGLAAP